jgi:rfaE bifunctional protein nucleotidyltransferase chain/domain
MLDASRREPSSIEETRAWRDAIAARGGKVVFTNGVFDLLHSGHVAYLDAARAAGDGLIVGLNTDASVRRLGKGPERPINSEMDRAYVLLGLKAVDQVVLFDEDTPLELIVALSPHILAKGADYTLEQIVGAKEVLAAGGDVLRIPLREGRSTTAMLRALRQS